MPCRAQPAYNTLTDKGDDAATLPAFKSKLVKAPTQRPVGETLPNELMWVRCLP